MANETGSLLWLGDVDTFTAEADEALTEGSFLKSTSSDDVVTTAGATSVADGDISVSMCDDTNDNGLIVGIAQTATDSVDPVNVMTEGIFIYQGDSVTAGMAVMASATAEKNYTVENVADGSEEHKIGRALTGTSTTNAFCVVIIRI